MSSGQGRQPRGVPAGGQFAPSVHCEPAVSLAARDVLPDSCLVHGNVTAESIDADGAERSVTAMTSTPEFDEQLRTHLGISDPSAPVEVAYEAVYFEEEEVQVYVASCAGKTVMSHSRDTLLKTIAEPKGSV